MNAARECRFRQLSVGTQLQLISHKTLDLRGDLDDCSAANEPIFLSSKKMIVLGE